MGKSGLMIMRMKIFLCSFLFVGALFLLVSAEEETLKEVASAELEIEEVELGFLRKAINFLWQNRVGYQHVWPDMEFGWQIIVGSLIGFFGAAFGSVGGVGGGGIYVPMLTLIIGFDSKSATAISKCMVMGAAVSTVYYNLKQRHPTLDMPVIDYDLALLFQPMLIPLKTSYRVNTVTSTKAFLRGVDTWKKETIMKKEAAQQSASNGTQGGEYKALPAGPEKKEEVSLIENVQWTQVGVLFLVWLAILALEIAQVSNTSISRNCALLCVILIDGYQISCISFFLCGKIPVAFGASGYEAVMLYKGKRVLASRGDAAQNWKVHQLILCCIMGICAGMVGGLLGLGGGFILGPLFLEMAIPPQVSSATATFAMMFSSSMSVVEYYLLKRFPIPYGGVGISNMIYKIQHNEYMGFDSLCAYKS
ncbi:hypothetical protein Cgig2_020520 [Carnegiea gigantea]|uniref:Sulfite exporter TauE/SafE family protein n=1 Tax=Carnegiea gigantea TaxID=171969 RepID=A0A9Q1KB67_9CARY|nr:hypothetical protein Cgig2_020520 [Carnegiea gigantea]